MAAGQYRGVEAGGTSFRDGVFTLQMAADIPVGAPDDVAPVLITPHDTRF